jgi:excisionase family DNA binding protein
MSIMSTGLGAEERPSARRTYSIDEVAKLFGIGRNQAYEAARRGDFPVIRLGKRIVAPKAAIDRMLAGEAA